MKMTGATDDRERHLNVVWLLVAQLSQNILSGLHEISRCVASRNYQRGLEVHTQVVSSSNFSEISAFMPILKVVMTIANKLGVWTSRGKAARPSTSVLAFKKKNLIFISFFFSTDSSLSTYIFREDSSNSDKWGGFL